MIILIFVGNWDFIPGSTLKASTATSSTNATDDGIDPVYGFGAEFNMGPNVDLVTGYEILKFDGDDVSYLFAGVKFGFGNIEKK